MNPLFLFVILALATALIAFFVKPAEKKDEEDGEEQPTEDSAQAGSHYAAWEECQRELSEAPPIEEAESLEMPPVDPRQMETPMAEEEEKKKSPFGAVVIALIVLMALLVLFNLYTLLRYGLGAMQLLPELHYDSVKAALWILGLGALYTALMIGLQTAIIILLARRNRKARIVYIIFFLFLAAMQIVDAIATNDPSRLPFRFTVLCLLHGSFLFYLYRSKRARSFFKSPNKK